METLITLQEEQNTKAYLHRWGGSIQELRRQLEIEGRAAKSEGRRGQG